MPAVGTSNTLRMSGMNSGFDTESIVAAMTASTKLRITQNQRKVLQLEAKQDAYRSVIDKLTAFKNKYFNLTNKSSDLRFASSYRSYTAKISVNGEEKKLAGVSVTTRDGAIQGDYEVELLEKATKAKASSSSFNSRQSFDAADYTTAAAGDKTYTMAVMAGDKTELITFESGATENETLDNINTQLKDAFGSTNTGTGIVSVSTNASGKVVFNATDKRAISTSNIMEHKDNVSMSIPEFGSGMNTISIMSGGEVKNVSFSTIESDYFNDIFPTDETPAEDIDADGYLKSADPTKVALFKEVVTDMYNTQRHDQYTAWKTASGAADSLPKTYANMTEAEKDAYKATISAMSGSEIIDAFGQETLDAYNNYAASAEEPVSFADYVTDSRNGVDTSEYYVDYVMGGMSSDQKDLFDMEVARRNEERRQTYFDKGIEKDYEAYKESALANGTAEEDLRTFDDFKTDYNIADFETLYPEEYEEYQDGLIDEKMFFQLSYNEEDAYNKNLYSGASEEDFLKDAAQNKIAAEAARTFNENAIKLNLEDMSFADGSKLEVTMTYDPGDPNKITGAEIKSYTLDADGNKVYQDIAMSMAKNSATDFGLEATEWKAGSASLNTTIGELGLTADANGNYNFSINGEEFSFTADAKINDIINKVNSSNAGVNMTFSSLTNTFELTSKEYGADAKIEITDGAEGLLTELGFDDSSPFTPGTNMRVSINGQEIETASNSYEIDGTTFTFSSSAKVGEKFDTSVTLDTTKAKDLIKDFIKDYNELVTFVYGMVDETPHGYGKASKDDYHFLTDDDKSEMGLSDTQIEQWETLAKKGILYNDSNIKDVMSKLRMSLMGSVEGSSGDPFGLFKLGISTSADYGEHGKLVIQDEDKFNQAFENNFDDIIKLFTDSENGLMKQLDDTLNYAVKSTGAREDKGILIQRAGLATGNSTMDNIIFDELKRLNTAIISLEERYERQQDRYWKMFSAMETQLGAINSQNGYISQLMGM